MNNTYCGTLLNYNTKKLRKRAEDGINLNSSRHISGDSFDVEPICGVILCAI